MSIVLLLLGILILVLAFVLKVPEVVKYRKWIVLVGLFIAVWGLGGLLIALIITIIAFLLVHFRVIRI